MPMAQFESLLWEGRPRRIARRRVVSERPLDTSSEWSARQLGKLGRPLLAEIETYLEFFALVRAPADEPYEG